MTKQHETAASSAGPPGYKKPLAVALMVLALVYDIVPTDIISDFMVLIGWSDDLLLTTLAALNLFNKFEGNFGKMVKGVAIAVFVIVLMFATLITYLLIRVGMTLFGG
jgi:hypothetical protein